VIRPLTTIALLLAWVTVFLALAHGDWHVFLGAVLLMFAIVRIGRP
jgi:hypothetical protein